MTPVLFSALAYRRVCRSAVLGGLFLLPLPLLTASAQVVPTLATPATLPAAVSTAAETVVPAASAASGPAAAQPVRASAGVRLALPDPALSRLAVELSGVVGGRFYRCPPSLRLPEQAICLYARGESSALQASIAAYLGDRVLGQWQASGPLFNLLLRPAAASTSLTNNPLTNNLLTSNPPANQYVALLDLGSGDHLLILNTQETETSAAAPTSTSAAPAGELYVVPSDLVGLVSVQRLDDRNYRFGVQGNAAANVALGSNEVAQNGVIAPLPSPLRQQGEQLYIPLSLLRAVGCVLTPGEKSEMVTVACGDSSVGVTPRRL